MRARTLRRPQRAGLQKLALRRKKVLGAEEMEQFKLAQAAGGAVDPDVCKILVDLLELNVKLASEPQDPAAAPLPTPGVPETRGRNKGSGAFGGGGPALPERGVREGSGQRMPRRPSATRLPKRGGPGKSPTRSGT
ncbi:hypothetical protein J1605_013672 [Eschrichtius robustus]|uniref:Mitotic-spindle organizing protein 2B n=1 Tax=Eschrichtius robustus TaxID=9764 RepID=A0AB34GJ04_ESCRO|nr:hypothetical protein J1605_013672 [Eschrichtius robustus]